jgi:hypothetical protein
MFMWAMLEYICLTAAVESPSFENNLLINDCNRLLLFDQAIHVDMVAIVASASQAKDALAGQEQRSGNYKIRSFHQRSELATQTLNLERC